MDPFVGEIRAVGFNFAPQGWALCNGQILSISTNTALFSLLGTQFGGDGRSTFGLPDLQGRVAIGQGQAPGLTDHAMGETGGVETVSLGIGEMPGHLHGLASGGNATSPLAGNAATTSRKIYGITAEGQFAAGAVGSFGSGQPHDNMQPTQFITYIIALQGIFPARP